MFYIILLYCYEKKLQTNNNNTQKKKFLEIFAKTGNVTLASKAVGWTRSLAYYYRENDREFADEWDNAREEAADRLEAEAFRRAFEGIDEPVYYKGEVKGVVKKYSDTLLMFLIRGTRPEKYRENHKIDMCINHQSTHTLAEMLKRIDGNSTFDKRLNINSKTKLLNAE